MKEEKISSNWKMAGAVVLLLATVIFVYAQYKSARPSIAQNAPSTGFRADGGPRGDRAPRAAGEERRDGPPMVSPEERAQMRETLLGSLNLTPEQQEKMDAIEKKYEGQEAGGRGAWRERMQEAQAVLTPAQQEKARTFMRSQARNRMAERLKVLPPKEQEIFMQKLEERFQDGRGPFGRDGRPPRDGAPPPPPEGGNPPPPPRN